jgi:hypothetical protein
VQVVDGLTENDGPFGGNGFVELDPIEVLRVVVVRFGDKAPWPVALPSGQFTVEEQKVLIRSLNLNVYPREGVLVHSHDLALEGDGKDERRQADPAHREGPGNTRPDQGRSVP